MIKNIFIACIICSFVGVSASCSYFDENRPEALHDRANEGDAEAMYSYAKYLQNTAPDEAFSWLEKAAKLNYIKAMDELADLYFERSSKQHNYDLAFKWVEKLAQRGDKFSQSRLGWLYANGKGTQQDYVSALSWYQKAAEQGDRYSTAYIAWMYFTGAGTGANNEEAFKWFKKAAELGDRKSQFILAYLYKHAVGTPVDLKQADFWFAKIAPYREELETDRSNIEYYDLDDTNIEQRIITQAKLNTKFKNENNEYFDEENNSFYKKYNQALDYLRGVNGVENYDRAFQILNELDPNNVDIAYHLAEMYSNGWGTAKNLAKAIQLYELAHEKKHWQAADQLGDIYFLGIDHQPPDYKKALYWYGFSHKKGYFGVNYKMAKIYAYGLGGVDKDPQKAFKLLNQSVNLGQTEAILMMAEFYEKGIGVQKNIKQASSFYTLAAKRGDVAALEKIEDHYANGLGMPKDRLKAYENYLKAVERKSTTAEVKLNKIALLLDAETQLELAMQYLHGNLEKSPLNKNNQMGLYWLKQSSLNGNENARSHIERLEREKK